MSAPAADLTTLLQAGALGQWTDRELLDRFINGRGSPMAEAAFAVLVARHGPMVLGVCRRMLGGDPHAAADAFQATFLVLVRKATAVRVDDSLGRWLHGVSVRVARKARTRNQADLARSRPLESIDPPAPSSPDDDLRGLIDAEVARLPRTLRAAVVLCHLEGLTHDQAARRLRCPVGTVHSRVHRARQKLRVALTRRGLAPSSALALPPVEVPAALASATVAGACRVAGAGRLAEVVSPGLIALVRSPCKEWSMIPGWLAPTVAAALTLVTSGVIGMTDAPSPPQTPPPAPAARADQPPTIAERFARLREEYDRRGSEMRRAIAQNNDPREKYEIREKMAPDDVAYCRKMIDLARTDPANPGSREALLWVLGFRNRSESGEYGDEFARAASLLVRHHGDDPEAVRIGLGLDNTVSPRRDALLAGLLASASSREARGLARLAMAQYLTRKSQLVGRARAHPERVKFTLRDAVAPDGEIKDRVIDEGDEFYSNRLLLAQSDAVFLAAEAKRLFEEVIAEYSEIPYITPGRRELERIIRQPVPSRLGQPLNDAAKDQIWSLLAEHTTLGDVARYRLDGLVNLAPGKPAPEIDGTSIDGKPLRLADYRGKVVALVFWASRSDFAAREIPRYKAMVEKYRDRPFALLGVACDDRSEVAAKTIADNEIPWPNWFDGDPDKGPICRRYHVDHFPTMVVIDADGIIRGINNLPESLDDVMARMGRRPDAPAPEPKPAAP